MNLLSHNNPLAATVTGLFDLLRPGDDLPPLDNDARLDGQTCLVTGASSGLGRAAAVELARRGGDMILACRSPEEKLLQAIRQETRANTVESFPVDLADLESVGSLSDRLLQRNKKIDVLVLNAGVMPRRSVRTPQGFELMFVVHFLANRLLVHRLIHDGVISGKPNVQERGPRILFVTSNAHQSAKAPDLARLGEFVEYGIRDGLAHYAQTKLLLTTMACHLSRVLNPLNEVRVAVHSLCPGAVDSNLAREAPTWVKPILRPVMKLAFNPPARAAEPLVHLACADWAGRETGVYLHMRRRRSVAPWARDPTHGVELWNASGRLLHSYLPDPMTVPI